MKIREIIPNEGPNPENLIIGLSKVIQRASLDNTSISIIVPNFSSIEGVITQTYGKYFIDSIKRNQPVKVADKLIKINIVSDRTMSSFNVQQIAFCVYLNSKTLEKINDFSNVKYELVIPWNSNDVEFYKKLWNL